MSNHIWISQIDTRHPDYQQVWQLREDVLRQPIGLSLKDEDLSADDKDFIVVARKGDAIIGCLMLQCKDAETIKLRQMAVHPDFQKQGIGAKLMHAAEHISNMYGYPNIILHARVTAQDFYSKLGYNTTSNVFTEVGIDHVVMKKKLQPY